MSYRNDFRPENTAFVGNLNEKVTERLLYELFVQAGPIEAVTIPKTKEGQSRLFGFVEFKDSVSVEYACNLMTGIELFHSPLVVRPQNTDRNSSYNTSRSILTDARDIPPYNDQRFVSNQRQHGHQNYPSDRPDYPINKFGGYVNREYFPHHPPPPPIQYSRPHFAYDDRNYSRPRYDEHVQRRSNGRKRNYNDD